MRNTVDPRMIGGKRLKVIKAISSSLKRSQDLNEIVINFPISEIMRKLSYRNVPEKKHDYKINVTFIFLDMLTALAIFINIASDSSNICS